MKVRNLNLDDLKWNSSDFSIVIAIWEDLDDMEKIDCKYCKKLLDYLNYYLD